MKIVKSFIILLYLVVVSFNVTGQISTKNNTLLNVPGVKLLIDSVYNESIVLDSVKYVTCNKYIYLNPKYFGLLFLNLNDSCISNWKYTIKKNKGLTIDTSNHEFLSFTNNYQGVFFISRQYKEYFLVEFYITNKYRGYLCSDIYKSIRLQMLFKIEYSNIMLSAYRVRNKTNECLFIE